MTRAWVITVSWAALLTVHWLVMWVFFDPDVLPAGLLVGSAAATAAIGGYLLLKARRDRRRPEVEVEAVADLSPATVTIAAGLMAAALAPELGLWIGLIGAGAMLWGLARLVGESRASREAAAAVARQVAAAQEAAGEGEDEEAPRAEVTAGGAGPKGTAGKRRASGSRSGGRKGGGRGSSGGAGRSSSAKRSRR